VGHVASAVGVSPQTLRVWEAKGLLVPRRSPGGQRLYSESDLERAKEIALLRRRHGWNSAAIADYTAGDRRPKEQARIGAIVRSARKQHGMTVAQLARAVDVSRSFISAVERGESGVSFQILARLAQALDLSLPEFAPRRSGMTNEVRPADRLITVLAGGVTWEELAVPGHALEPALLLVPAGESSGGPISRPGEIFVRVHPGAPHYSRRDAEPEIALDEGAALTLPAGSTWSWSNPGPGATRAVCLDHRA
jgi:DNA-binding transcriptional MerR regulator